MKSRLVGSSFVVVVALVGLACGGGGKKTVADGIAWRLSCVSGACTSSYDEHLLNGIDGDDGIGVNCSLDESLFTATLSDPGGDIDTDDDGEIDVMGRRSASLEIVRGNLNNAGDCKIRVTEAAASSASGAVTWEEECTDTGGTCTLTLTPSGKNGVQGSLRCDRLAQGALPNGPQFLELGGPPSAGADAAMVIRLDNCD